MTVEKVRVSSVAGEGGCAGAGASGVERLSKSGKPSVAGTAPAVSWAPLSPDFVLISEHWKVRWENLVPGHWGVGWCPGTRDLGEAGAGVTGACSQRGAAATGVGAGRPDPAHPEVPGERSRVSPDLDSSPSHLLTRCVTLGK